MTYEHWYSVFR